MQGSSNVAHEFRLQFLAAEFGHSAHAIAKMHLNLALHESLVISSSSHTRPDQDQSVEPCDWTTKSLSLSRPGNYEGNAVWILQCEASPGAKFLESRTPGDSPTPVARHRTAF